MWSRWRELHKTRWYGLLLRCISRNFTPMSIHTHTHTHAHTYSLSLSPKKKIYIYIYERNFTSYIPLPNLAIRSTRFVGWLTHVRWYEKFSRKIETNEQQNWIEKFLKEKNFQWGKEIESNDFSRIFRTLVEVRSRLQYLHVSIQFHTLSFDALSCSFYMIYNLFPIF